MTLPLQLIPAKYSLGDGFMIVRGKTVSTIEFALFAYFLNANDRVLFADLVTLDFTDQGKPAFVNAVGNKIAELESATGLSRIDIPVTDLETAKNALIELLFKGSI